MTARQRRKYEMFLRARDFFAQHAADFPAATVAGQLVAALSAIINELDALSVNKISSTGDAAQNLDVRGDACDRLEDMLQDISDLTKPMSYEVTGLENKFRLPRSRSARNLIAAGHAFGSDIAVYEDEFVGYGMPADFLAKLNAATAALEQADTASNASTQERVGTNAAFDAPVKRGIEKINRLAPLVRMKYRTNPANLAAWLYASHVQRAPAPPASPTPET